MEVIVESVKKIEENGAQIVHDGSPSPEIITEDIEQVAVNLHGDDDHDQLGPALMRCICLPFTCLMMPKHPPEDVDTDDAISSSEVFRRLLIVDADYDTVVCSGFNEPFLADGFSHLFNVQSEKLGEGEAKSNLYKESDISISDSNTSSKMTSRRFFSWNFIKRKLINGSSN